MPEALSSSEIEDVLSSIRRLVSDDLRTPMRGAVAAPLDEKLILTPSLRVVQTEPPQPSVILPAIEDVVATVSAGVSSQQDNWESETGDLQPLALEPSGSEWALPEPEMQGADFAVDGEVESASLEVFHSWRSQEVQDILRDGSDETSGDGGSDPTPAWAQEQDGEDDENPQADTMVEGTIEPDPAWADEAEAAIVQELAAASPPELDEDEFVLNESVRDFALDEDVLREIVRDIIREELQGTLGERITRNIRKLVRAEIARVRATEDLL
jgi:hypothetical protein